MTEEIIEPQKIKIINKNGPVIIIEDDADDQDFWPKLNGFELREKLKTDEKLNIKCIPYLFFSTALNQQSVIDAYSLSVQGFFVKQNSMEELEKQYSLS